MDRAKTREKLIAWMQRGSYADIEHVASTPDDVTPPFRLHLCVGTRVMPITAKTIDDLFAHQRRAVKLALEKEEIQESTEAPAAETISAHLAGALAAVIKSKYQRSTTNLTIVEPFKRTGEDGGKEAPTDKEDSELAEWMVQYYMTRPLRKAPTTPSVSSSPSLSSSPTVPYSPRRSSKAAASQDGNSAPSSSTRNTPRAFSKQVPPSTPSAGKTQEHNGYFAAPTPIHDSNTDTGSKSNTGKRKRTGSIPLSLLAGVVKQAVEENLPVTSSSLALSAANGRASAITAWQDAAFRKSLRDSIVRALGSTE